MHLTYNKYCNNYCNFHAPYGGTGHEWKTSSLAMSLCMLFIPNRRQESQTVHTSKQLFMKNLPTVNKTMS